ncbi:MAG TPA: DEAD/DEAH box helicase, partial [Gemmatimonadales bacterium]|nr:DEAD/DEAH box helicase [Gemmatimonadales bacterium]
MTLPVESVLPALTTALRDSGAAVLIAPPGAGKTTRVPLALLAEPWLSGRIVLLEPRRIAARSAAGWMARTLDEEPGATVGYRIRREARVSARTRIEVVTEGILTRMLEDDPSLPGVGLVVFDEFHERNLHADLGLALALEARAALREDLRLLVMSATLDGGPVAGLLGGVPVVSSAGRT